MSEDWNGENSCPVSWEYVSLGVISSRSVWLTVAFFCHKFSALRSHNLCFFYFYFLQFIFQQFASKKGCQWHELTHENASLPPPVLNWGLHVTFSTYCSHSLGSSERCMTIWAPTFSLLERIESCLITFYKLSAHLATSITTFNKWSSKHDIESWKHSCYGENRAFSLIFCGYFCKFYQVS